MEILAKLHPFNGNVVRETVIAGMPISAILDHCAKKNNVNGWYTKDVYVELNGKPILPKDFDLIRVNEDDNLVVQFCVPLGGDGKSILRTVLMIVVAVVSIYVGGLPALGVYGAYGAAATMVVGGLLVNMLVPIEPLSSTGLGHDDSTKTNIYSISGMRNNITPYGCLPVLLGTMRYAPIQGAVPYTTISGNDQFLHCIFVWGSGKIYLTDLRIGDTPTSSYSDITIKTGIQLERVGTAAIQKLFANAFAGSLTSAIQNMFSSVFTGESTTNIYPYDTYPETVGALIVYGEETVRTTQPETDSATIDYVLAKGLFGVNTTTGEKVSLTVTIRSSYRISGTSTWTVYDDTSITQCAQYPVRGSITIPFKDISWCGRGQFDIKLERWNLTSSNAILYDEITWGILTSIKYEDPVTFDCDITETQMLIKATDQLSGPIDNFNGIGTTVCWDYDIATGGWLWRATNNPASLYRYVYQGEGIADPLTDAEIDIPALEEWHEFCRRMGFTYNKIHDGQMSVDAVINDICAAGRASFVRYNDVHSVVIDQPKVYGAVQYFTPENSKGFSVTKTFPEELHGYRVLFNNEDTDYVEDELIVYTQEYTHLNATLLESKQISGVTNVTQLRHLVKYHLAVRRYRSELFTWSVPDWEHIACSRGDLVKVSNPVIVVSIATGRIKEIDAGAKIIVLDQEVYVPAGTNYGLCIRTNPGTTSYSEVFTVPVTAAEATTDTFTVTGSFPTSITVGCLYGIGEIGYEALDLLITSKRPTKDMGGTITAVAYAWDEIEAYINGAFPELHTGITSHVFVPRETPPPPIISYVATGVSSSVRKPDGTTLNRITMMVTIPTGWSVAVDSIRAEISTLDGWLRAANTDPSQPIVWDGIEPGDVEIRVQSVSAKGLTSAWVYRTVTQVQGIPVPDAPIAMTITGRMFVNNIDITLPTTYRNSWFIEIYCTVGINDRASSTRVAKLSGGHTWAHSGLTPGISYFYWTRIVDEQGTTSVYYPLSATGGIEAVAETDNAILLDMLTASISDSQLTTELNTQIANAGSGITVLQEQFYNAWTVKIQEIDDTPYLVGMGLALYPDWVVGDTHGGGDYVWMADLDEVYRLPAGTSDRVATLENQPPITPWVLVPYGRKSQFSIMADQFAVVTPDGTGKVVPFVVSDDVVGINGSLLVNGSVRANALYASDVFPITLQSQNYVDGVSGYKLDSVNGTAKFYNIAMTFSYTNLTNKPTTLATINATESSRLGSAYTLSLDPATRINSYTTTINGGKITTDSIDTLQLNGHAVTHDSHSELAGITQIPYSPYMQNINSVYGTKIAGITTHIDVRLELQVFTAGQLAYYEVLANGVALEGGVHEIPLLQDAYSNYVGIISADIRDSISAAGTVLYTLNVRHGQSASPYYGWIRRATISTTTLKR